MPLWLLRDGFDVEGSDISPDMLELCRRKAAADGLTPTLHQASMSTLDLPGRYRTVVVNGAFGLNGTRDDDVAALRRLLDHLEPGGTLAFDLEPGWAWWGGSIWDRASDRDRLTATPWTGSSATPMPDGDSLVSSERLVLVDPLEQRFVKDVCIDLVRGGPVLRTELHRLVARWHPPSELVPLMEGIGLEPVEVFGDFTDEPVRVDHGTHVYVATKGLDAEERRSP